MWNSEYRRHFDIEHEIPSFFIDPVFNLEYAEEEETKINARYSSQLFQLASNITPYECSVNCQPPEDFFSGYPGLMEPNMEKKRIGSSAVFTWQVWLKGCGTTVGNQSYILYFNNEEITNPKEISLNIEETIIAKGNILQV